MIINEMNSDTNRKYIRTTFDYKEIRDIANGLYYISLQRKEYSEIYAKCKFLFDMIKHGNIQKETINFFSTLNKDEEDDSF